MQRQVGADRVLRVRDDDDVYRVKEWFFFQEKVQVAEKIEEENNNKCKNEKQNLRKSVQQAFKEKIERERERQLFGRKKNSLIEIEFRRGTFQYELWKDFFLVK